LSLFKRRRCPVEVIRLCGRWSCTDGISSRALAAMMRERGVDKPGRLIAVLPSDRRDPGAADRVLRQALKGMSVDLPSSRTTDPLASSPKALRRLQGEGLPAQDVEHRTSKDLNNVIEADHGGLKRVRRMIRRGHCILQQPGATGDIRRVTQLFRFAA
jgi:transposase-like protein